MKRVRTYNTELISCCVGLRWYLVAGNEISIITIQAIKH